MATLARSPVRLAAPLLGRAVVPNRWERLEAPFVRNVEEQAARLAMNGVRIVSLQPAGGALITDLVGSDERLQEPQKQGDTEDHYDDRGEPP